MTTLRAVTQAFLAEHRRLGYATKTQELHEQAATLNLATDSLPKLDQVEVLNYITSERSFIRK